jgi:uncharacterized membrane protein SpoIIM required for sporulation
LAPDINVELLPGIRGLLTKRWALFVALIFVADLALFIASSLYPVPPSDVESVVNQAKGLVEGLSQAPLPVKVLLIFANNARIAVVEFVPVLGTIVFAVSSFTTGQVLSATAATTGIPSPLLVFAVFSSPHSWLELPAYALAAAQSLLLIYAAATRSFKFELRRTGVVMAIDMIVLFYAAFLESVTIELGLLGVPVAWVLLFPFLLGGYLAYRSARA